MNSLWNIIYRVFCIVTLLLFMILSVLNQNLFMLVIMCTAFIIFSVYVFYSYIIERLDKIKDNNNQDQTGN